MYGIFTEQRRSIDLSTAKQLMEIMTLLKVDWYAGCTCSCCTSSPDMPPNGIRPHCVQKGPCLLTNPEVLIRDTRIRRGWMRQLRAHRLGKFAVMAVTSLHLCPSQCLHTVHKAVEEYVARTMIKYVPTKRVYDLLLKALNEDVVEIIMKYAVATESELAQFNTLKFE